MPDDLDIGVPGAGFPGVPGGELRAEEEGRAALHQHLRDIQPDAGGLADHQQAGLVDHLLDREGASHELRHHRRKPGRGGGLY